MGLLWPGRILRGWIDAEANQKIEVHPTHWQEWNEPSNEVGASWETLAGALGLTFQQVQKYEKGANRVSARRLHHISQILQVPVPFFFEGAPGGAEEVPGVPTYVNEFLASSDGVTLTKAFTRIGMQSCAVYPPSQSPVSRCTVGQLKCRELELSREPTSHRLGAQLELRPQFGCDLLSASLTGDHLGWLGHDGGVPSLYRIPMYHHMHVPAAEPRGDHVGQLLGGPLFLHLRP